MKKVNLLLLLGLFFVSNLVLAKAKIHCSDSLYVGKTMSSANLDNGTFLVEREIAYDLHEIIYETIIEGIIINVTTVGEGLVTLLELEGIHGESGTMQFSKQSLSDEMPRLMRPAKLEIDGRQYGFGLICF
ncbi:MAG: hypothetical protein QF441_09450 [Bacteriovoracaceae bacterium]|jgi:hypothetical protein|nr:hypothetical protein [Bacteriovoracaceae bacterium]